jgi:hypothetical protein
LRTYKRESIHAGTYRNHGANAAGAKAASKAKRMNPETVITVVNRGSFIFCGACGIPYFVSDAVSDEKDLMSKGNPYHVCK